MKKVLVLGSTGMLGHTVNNYFKHNCGFHTVATSRRPYENTICFDALTDPVDILPTDFDYVINCIGVIKPHVQSHLIETIKLNALFPLELGVYCKANDMKLIHVTTDCVYSGGKGHYVESDPHDAIDVYGKSKSLGECESDAMVLRTSIIGMEVSHFVSLISWALSQAGKTIDGYFTHHWNGITTERYAAICKQIIEEDLYEHGLFHIHAADDVSKYELLHYIDRKFNLNLKINKAYPGKIDRTLRSEKELCSLLNLPTVEEMVMEMGR